MWASAPILQIMSKWWMYTCTNTRNKRLSIFLHTCWKFFGKGTPKNRRKPASHSNHITFTMLYDFLPWGNENAILGEKAFRVCLEGFQPIVQSVELWIVGSAYKYSFCNSIQLYVFQTEVCVWCSLAPQIIQQFLRNVTGSFL